MGKKLIQQQLPSTRRLQQGETAECSEEDKYFVAQTYDPLCSHLHCHYSNRDKEVEKSCAKRNGEKRNVIKTRKRFSGKIKDFGIFPSFK